MTTLLTVLFIPSAVAQYAPVFQFAIFYNLDLEINPGTAMTIKGHVHSNGNIWTTGSSSSQLMTYAGLVDTSQAIYYTRSPNDPQAYSTGNVFFSVTNNNPLTNVPTLTLPFGTDTSPAGVAGLLNLPPANLIVPNDNAYSPTGSVYLYNSCDLIISNAASGTDITVYYSNPFTTPRLTTVLPDIVRVSTNLVAGVWRYKTNLYFSYVTNTSFYDYRESKTVRSVEIDVSKLLIWLTNYAPTPYAAWSRGGKPYNDLNSSGGTTKGHGINSIYVYNNIAPSLTTLPAVRLVNGSRLPPDGLTVATPQPLYVKGDYNTTTNGSTVFSPTNGAVPAAIMGDAVTILSANWIDAYNSATSLASRGAASTTINAACLEGIVESATDSGGNKYYSGGLPNYFRLLEDWSGDSLTYNGSFVVMFASQYATNHWLNPGTYYTAPTRQWGFDVNFLNPNKLPPLTPMVAITNPPVIVSHPQSQTNTVGGTTVFTITTFTNVAFESLLFVTYNFPYSQTGLSSSLKYQWSLNGTNITGATNRTLTLTSIQPDQAGTYTVQATNYNGSVISSNAVLTVYLTTAALLDGISFSGGNQIQFNIVGVPGFKYAVQATTNLIDWLPLVTNTSPFSFTDTNLSGIPQQFYRTVHVP